MSAPASIPVPADDAGLVRAAQGGTPAAFDTLVQRHLPRVWAIARAIVRDPSAADDVAQQTFLRAWQKLATLDAPERFGPWCRTIARNAARNWLRDHRPRAASLAGDLPEPADPARPAPEVAGDREAVARAVGLLPDDLAEAIRLRFEAGLSYQEMADALDVPLSTVRDRLYRARGRLREILQS